MPWNLINNYGRSEMQITKRSSGRRSVSPYLYIAPAFFVYAVFILIPLLCAIVFSFTNYNIQNMKFTGLANYARMLGDRKFHQALLNTLLYSFFVVAVNLVLGLLLAAILGQRWFKGSAFCRSVLYIPYIVSPIAASMIWLYLYDSKVGVINMIMKGLGFSGKSWLLDEKTALPCLIVMGIWQGVGYCMVVYFSALKNIPDYLYEAARIDGASAVTQFFKISIPLLSSTTFFLLVMTMISSFQVFAQIMVMTGGGPLGSTTTIAHQIYENAFVKYSMGYASSQAVVLFAIVLLFTLIFFKYGNKEGDVELD